VNLFDDMSVSDNVALAIFAREGKTKRFLRSRSASGGDPRSVGSARRVRPRSNRGRRGGSRRRAQLLDVAVAYALRPRCCPRQPTSGVSSATRRRS